MISALRDTAMERSAPGRAVLHGVVDEMGTVMFVLMTHFLADAVGILGLLSLSLQKEDVTYTLAQSQIDATIFSCAELTDHSRTVHEIYSKLTPKPS